jgi:hypothetical protein
LLSVRGYGLIIGAIEEAQAVGFKVTEIARLAKPRPVQDETVL